MKVGRGNRFEGVERGVSGVEVGIGGRVGRLSEREEKARRKNP